MSSADVTRDDRGTDLLEPDLILPEQLFPPLRRGITSSGERRLLAAVLEDGIDTFRRFALARDPLGQELFDEARTWIVARHDRSLFSFTTVCEILEIDATYLRGGLLRWLATQRDGPRCEAPTTAMCDPAATHAGAAVA